MRVLYSSILVSLGVLLGVILAPAATTPSTECSMEEQEATFSQMASQDCFNAWKHGAAFVDEVMTFYDTICRPDCLRALREFGEQCKIDTIKSLEYLRYDCATNENGEHCYTIANEHNEIMHNVYTNCWNVSKTCTSDCRGAIESFRETHGCCANSLYNTTEMVSDMVRDSVVYFNAMMGVTDAGLWRQCGVGALGWCEVPEGFAVSGAGAAVTRVTLVGGMVLPVCAHWLVGRALMFCQHTLH